MSGCWRASRIGEAARELFISLRFSEIPLSGTLLLRQTQWKITLKFTHSLRFVTFLIIPLLSKILFVVYDRNTDAENYWKRFPLDWHLILKSSALTTFSASSFWRKAHFYTHTSGVALQSTFLPSQPIWLSAPSAAKCYPVKNQLALLLGW